MNQSTQKEVLEKVALSVCDTKTLIFRKFAMISLQDGLDMDDEFKKLLSNLEFDEFGNLSVNCLDSHTVKGLDGNLTLLDFRDVISKEIGKQFIESVPGTKLVTLMLDRVDNDAGIFMVTDFLASDHCKYI